MRFLQRMALVPLCLSSLGALDITPLQPGFDAILRSSDDVPSVMMTLVILNAEAKEKG